MAFQVAFKGKPGPLLMQLNAVHSETDAGKIFPYDDLESAEGLVVDKVDVLIVGRDQTDHVTEIDRTTGNKA
jgi:hypothetical protein